MSDSPFQRQPLSEPIPTPEIENVSRRRNPLRNCGCFILILLWLAVLVILPCGFVTLLVEKELIFDLSDLPDDELRLFLLNDEDSRGIGFQRPELYSGGEDEGQYCILIRTNYYLWEGEADPLTRCNCYEKIEDEWMSTVVGGDTNCNPIQFNFTE